MILSIGAAFAFVNDKGMKFELPTMKFFINKKEEKLASEITEDDIEEN